MKLSGKKVAILATHGFEQSELEVPRDKLKAAGATVHIISPENGEIKGWQERDGEGHRGNCRRPSPAAQRRRIAARDYSAGVAAAAPRNGSARARCRGSTGLLVLRATQRKPALGGRLSARLCVGVSSLPNATFPAPLSCTSLSSWNYKFKTRWSEAGS
jgi:putative intracellular protease/amidase